MYISNGYYGYWPMVIIAIMANGYYNNISPICIDLSEIFVTKIFIYVV